MPAFAEEWARSRVSSRMIDVQIFWGAEHDGVRSLHQRLALFDRVFVFVPFKEEDFPQGKPVDAVADVAAHLAMFAMWGPSLSIAWQPISKWLDEGLAAGFGLPSRELELGTAIDLRIMTEMVRGRPMSQAGHSNGFIV